ncbi:MAG: inorganic diphosphatase [Flavobacteriales bacterium]|nr:inorganic diphosphatase [Flavobacteriales bacterium]
MKIKLIFITYFLLTFIFFSCNRSKSEEVTNISNSAEEVIKSKVDLLRDITPLFEDGDVNAVIEIPSGTLEKWELNKSTGQVQWELVDNTPRIVNYLGYPGNYGMIPQTLLSKEKGGDGDPLDIIVLGPPSTRGGIVKCKIIGVLYLMDRGERDDKLIAVSAGSPLYQVNDMTELNKNYKGISEIIKLWFTNYKGTGKMESEGFGDKKTALAILRDAIDEFDLIHTKQNKK